MNQDMKFIREELHKKVERSAEINKNLAESRVCPVCGKSFRPSFESQAYCSVICSKIHENGENIWNSEQARIEFMEHWKRLFELAGEDSDRPGLVESPKRILKMWQEVFEGNTYSNDEIAEMNNKCFDDFDDSGEPDWFDGMVVMRDIPVFSHCEHHATLMYNAKVNVGYIPKGKVIGLSKMARIADMVSKRFQLQERIGNDIRYVLSKIVETEDVIVVIEAEHGCMTARGIKKPGTTTVTASLGGVFSTEPETRNEFYSALKVGAGR